MSWIEIVVLISIVAAFVSLGVIVLRTVFRALRQPVRALRATDPSVAKFVRRNVVALLLLYMMRYLITSIPLLGPFETRTLTEIVNALIAPFFTVAADLLTFYVVIVVVWMLVRRMSLLPQPLSPAVDESVIAETAKQVFTSDRFLSALQEVLPRGERDSEYGLDYIPYMLHSINARKRKFERAANRFLTGTVVLGLVFATVVILFGYILIVEAATGPQRS